MGEKSEGVLSLNLSVVTICSLLFGLVPKTAIGIDQHNPPRRLSLKEAAVVAFGRVITPEETWVIKLPKD